MMRRQSLSSSLSSSSGGVGEPLIVVEESTLGEEEAELQRSSESPPRCLDPDSPSLNPYLLSPWRETRKHSLPTPACTSGITASQVRRLSERGGEGSGPSPREAAFLATLSQSQPPQPGGRRHSVVTISRVPPTLFGRNRRESIAAFPMGGATRILSSRRESASGLPSGPPSNCGSTHNLELDIMDDIAEIKARKVRLKMWKTGSRERVCEVQPLEGNGSGAQRYTQYQQRRYSDFALASIPSIPSPICATGSIRRRASEMPARPLLGTLPGTPPPIPPRRGFNDSAAAAGIVCTNTDLISILSSLATSAEEIDRCGREEEAAVPVARQSSLKSLEQRRDRLKSSRSSSFDVSILHGCEAKQAAVSKSSASAGGGGGGGSMSPSSWFAKRHQPKKPKNADSPSSALSFKFEKSKVVKAIRDTLVKTSPTKEEGASGLRHKVVWDGSSGTQVDPQVLGSAIEERLRRRAAASGESSEAGDNPKAISPGKAPARALGGSNSGKVAGWFGGGAGGSSSSGAGAASGKDDEPSICSSLKDLIVK